MSYQLMHVMCNISLSMKSMVHRFNNRRHQNRLDIRMKEEHGTMLTVPVPAFLLESHDERVIWSVGLLPSREAREMRMGR